MAEDHNDIFDPTTNGTLPLNSFADDNVCTALDVRWVHILRVFNSVANLGGLCRASDSLCMLKPIFDTDGDVEARIIIVYRFLRPTDDEKSCSFLWIEIPPDDINISDTEIVKIIQSCREKYDGNDEITAHNDAHSSFFLRYLELVGDVKFLRTHRSGRVNKIISSVSSTEKLENGERYVVYRFLLYWDRFTMTDGKNSSAEGVYKWYHLIYRYTRGPELPPSE